MGFVDFDFFYVVVDLFKESDDGISILRKGVDDVLCYMYFFCFDIFVYFMYSLYMCKCVCVCVLMVFNGNVVMMMFCMVIV